MIKFVTEKLVVPIDKIMPNRWNPNYQTKAQFEKQKQSMRELGFVGSVFVRRVKHTSCDYEILDGEHRWKGLKEEGATECPIECFKEDVSDADAQVMTVLFNNLRGQDDIEKRAKILEALGDKQLSLLPMSADEIENEKALFKFDFSKYDKEETVPEREFAKVIVLGFNSEEAALWDMTMERMQGLDMVTAKVKKKADIQMVMRLIKQFSELAFAGRFDKETGELTVDK